MTCQGRDKRFEEGGEVVAASDAVAEGRVGEDEGEARDAVGAGVGDDEGGGGDAGAGEVAACDLEGGGVAVGAVDGGVGAEEGALAEFEAGADEGIPDDIVVADAADEGEGGGDGGVGGGGDVILAVSEADLGERPGDQLGPELPVAEPGEDFPGGAGGVVEEGAAGVEGEAGGLPDAGPAVSAIAPGDPEASRSGAPGGEEGAGRLAEEGRQEGGGLLARGAGGGGERKPEGEGHPEGGEAGERPVEIAAEEARRRDLEVLQGGRCLAAQDLLEAPLASEHDRDRVRGDGVEVEEREVRGRNRVSFATVEHDPGAIQEADEFRVRGVEGFEEGEGRGAADLAEGLGEGALEGEGGVGAEASEEGGLGGATGEAAEGEGGLAGGGEVRVVEEGDQGGAEGFALGLGGEAAEEADQASAGGGGGGAEAVEDEGGDGGGAEQGALDLGDEVVVGGSEQIQEGEEMSATWGEARIMEQGEEEGHGACKVGSFEYGAGPTSGGSQANPQPRGFAFSLRTRHHANVPYLYSADPNLPPEALQTLVAPVLAAQGVGLVELQFRRERPGWVLRVMIENPEGPEPGAGITLDRCADVSRGLSEALDAAELIQPAYTLEVGSPGVERPLHDEADYRRFSGQRAKIVLKKPLEAGALKGQAALEGVLRDEGGPQLEVARRGETHREPLVVGDIKQAHLVYDPKAASRGRSEGKGTSPRRRPGHGKNSE